LSLPYLKEGGIKGIGLLYWNYRARGSEITSSEEFAKAEDENRSPN